MRKELSSKRIFFISITVVIATLAVFFIYGLIYVWYRNTGFREWNQPAFKSQESINPKVPAQTITTKGKTPPVDTREQANAFKNPFKPTADSISNGSELYHIYCAPCHGSDGKGQGIMGAVPVLSRVSEARERRLSTYLEGYLSLNPGVDANFIEKRSDGDIFYTITNGGEYIMPGFQDALSPEQRWNTINYIRTGLGDNIGR